MELLDVVNDRNELTGEIKDKDEIHAKNLFHREVGA